MLTEEGQTIVEGRPAKRYAVSLAPPSDAARAARERQTGAPYPESLEGFVVIDEATAVRLEIDVKGVLSEPAGQREVQLKASRTAIGEVPLIISPPEARKQRRKGRGGKADGSEAGQGTELPGDGDAFDGEASP